MQLSEQEFCADWVARMGKLTPLTTATVLQYLNLRAQAEARPVGEWVKHRHWDAPHLKWNKGYIAKIGDKLFTHPAPAAAQAGLSDEAIKFATMLRTTAKIARAAGEELDPDCYDPDDPNDVKDGLLNQAKTLDECADMIERRIAYGVASARSALATQSAQPAEPSVNFQVPFGHYTSGKYWKPEEVVTTMEFPAAEPSGDERRVMQLAAISTAAYGYWKEGDSIHPDYDSTALRDTAKLYATYDELFKAAQSGQRAGEPQNDPWCPRCKGHGEETAMSNNGPDAEELIIACQHCGGEGSLAEAYKGVVKLLAEEQKKYLDACGKLWFERHGDAGQRAGVVEDARDAARYRWWRAVSGSALRNAGCLRSDNVPISGQELDAAIDAAMLAAAPAPAAQPQAEGGEHA